MRVVRKQGVEQMPGARVAKNNGNAAQDQSFQMLNRSVGNRQLAAALVQAQRASGTANSGGIGGSLMPPKMVAGDSVQDSDSCLRENCAGKDDQIKADLQQALADTARVLAALSNPSPETKRLLDWYFSDHSETTIKTVHERLTYIRTALQDTFDNRRYGCGSHPVNTAHTWGGDTLYVDSKAPVCFNPPYFEPTRSLRERIETLVHEGGHRIGLSLKEFGTPDTYVWYWAFRHLSTAQALSTTESYATFVGAMVYGAPTSLLMLVGAGSGVTSLGSGFEKVHVGVEAENARLRGISPNVGLSFASLNRRELDEFLVSVFLGARFADARPGDKGSIYLNLSGELSFIGGDTLGVGTGIEAKLGYRVGHYDIGVTGGALRDPTPATGARTVYSGGLSFSYILFSIP